MFHIETIQVPVVSKKKNKGNGGKCGRGVGRRARDYNDETSIFNSDGCLKHGIKHCENCTLDDCDWDYDTEWNMRMALKNGKNNN